jgi:hypothetical protein
MKGCLRIYFNKLEKEEQNKSEAAEGRKCITERNGIFFKKKNDRQSQSKQKLMF